MQYWGNAYSYDSWGNLLQKTITKCGAENILLTADNHNRIATAGYAYDAAGNMTADGTEGLTLNYDQENRITGANGYTYTYDADGNRVEKSNGSTGTLYWYMTPGIVAESDLTGALKSEYVFFNGERIARRDLPSGSVAYYFSDHLKTASVITDSAGNINSDSDYYPWGGELQFVANDSNHYKFTGKERDTETGLDYFGARYYSNQLGRFSTPDRPFADQHPTNPQTWNLYAYTLANPLKFVDHTGTCNAPAVGPGQVGICIDTWIRRTWINGPGRGDGSNRGPVANDPKSSFRTEEKWVINYTEHKIVSHEKYAARSGLLFKNFGLRGTAESSAEDKHVDSGNFYFRDHLEGENGFGQFFSGLGPIEHDIVFKVSPTGSVDIDAAGRKSFPSIEIWSYDEKGNSHLLWYIPERDPSDLNGRENQFFHGHQQQQEPSDKPDDPCGGKPQCP